MKHCLHKGRAIVLKATTRHGKNRIHQHGDIWWIKEVRNDRMLLESNDRTDRGEFDWRWIDLQDDRDFTWELAR